MTDSRSLQVLNGELGVKLPLDDELSVGIDVAVFEADSYSFDETDTRYVRGVPLLAAEITSPSDTVQSIADKRIAYRRAGVPMVWVVDPATRCVTVFSDAPTRTFHEEDVLVGGDVLPDFEVAVSELFLPEKAP